MNLRVFYLTRRGLSDGYFLNNPEDKKIPPASKRVGFLFFWRPNLVIYLRPRVVLPSAASSATLGRE